MNDKNIAEKFCGRFLLFMKGGSFLLPHIRRKKVKYETNKRKKIL